MLGRGLKNKKKKLLLLISLIDLSQKIKSPAINDRAFYLPIRLRMKSDSFAVINNHFDKKTFELQIPEFNELLESKNILTNFD